MFFLRQLQRQLIAQCMSYEIPQEVGPRVENPEPEISEVGGLEGAQTETPEGTLTRAGDIVGRTSLAAGIEEQRLARLTGGHLEDTLEFQEVVGAIDSGNMFISEEMRSTIEQELRSDGEFLHMTPEEQAEAYIERAIVLKVEQFDLLSIEDRTQILEGDTSTDSIGSVINEVSASEGIDGDLLARAMAQNLEGFEFDIDGQPLTDPETGELLVGDALRQRINEYAERMRERLQNLSNQTEAIDISQLGPQELLDLLSLIEDGQQEDTGVSEEVPQLPVITNQGTGTGTGGGSSGTGGGGGAPLSGPRGVPGGGAPVDMGPGGAETTPEHVENGVLTREESAGENALTALINDPNSGLTEQDLRDIESIREYGEGFYPVAMDDGSIIFVSNPTYAADAPEFGGPGDQVGNGVSAQEATNYANSNNNWQLVNFAEAEASLNQAQALTAMTIIPDTSRMSDLNLSRQDTAMMRNQLAALIASNEGRLVHTGQKIMAQNTAGRTGMFGGVRNINTPGDLYQPSSSLGEAHMGNNGINSHADYSQCTQVRHVRKVVPGQGLTGGTTATS